jgi:predicted RNase H-like HicB family nuclease
VWTMTELTIHLEAVEGEVVWWADSPDVPGFSAAAPSLVELRERATAALEEILGAPVPLVEHLDGVPVGRRDVDHWDARVAQTDLVPC